MIVHPVSFADKPARSPIGIHAGIPEKALSISFYALYDHFFIRLLCIDIL